MNQDSFRRLLSTPRPGTSAHPSILPPKTTAAISQPKKTADDRSAAFKPHKIDKKFRDRAAERREGVNGDFAQIEAILEDFEQRTANEDRAKVAEQRKYLGGDGDHSILVKGLDFALLQANKARAGNLQEEEMDAALDEAFVEAASSSTTAKLEDVASPSTLVPKKRTREEAIEELKRNYTNGPGGSLPTESNAASGTDALEWAKKRGKFRPIGAPPPEPPKVTDQGEKRKKRKRNVVIVGSLRAAEVSPAATTTAQPDRTKPPSPPPNGMATGPESLPPTNTAALEKNVQAFDSMASRCTESPPPTCTGTTVIVPPVPPTLPSATNPQDDSDTDIFAGAGDYEGLDLGGEDDDPDDPPGGRTLLGEDDHVGLVRPRWFGDDGDEALPNANSTPATARTRSKSPSPGSSRPQAAKQADDAEDRDSSSHTVRLQPLATSALPSIKDLLEIDKAAEVHEKKKSQRERNKAKSGARGSREPVEPKKKTKLGSEAKLNRDYQQYTSYVEKKGKGS